MKIAIIGANGQLGTDLCKELVDGDLVPLNHADIEIADVASVNTVLGRHKPDIVINTAAFLKADNCEDEVDKAYQINAIGARNVAVVCQKIGAKLVHISTDYVFGGEGDGRNIPYTEFDTPLPLSIYGKCKLEGEKFVQNFCLRYFIVRTSGFFGVAGSRSKGGNFVETILKSSKEQPEIRVVNDQVFSPTSTRDLARKISELMITECYGIYHITNKGSCSWYEFTVEILKLANVKTPVIPITSEQYPQKAKRPHYSVMDHYQLRLLGMDDMRPWQDALKDYMMEKEKGHSK